MIVTDVKTNLKTNNLDYCKKLQQLSLLTTNIQIEKLDINYNFILNYAVETIIFNGSMFHGNIRLIFMNIFYS